MAKTYFIADLHLDDSQPEGLQKFLGFIAHLKQMQSATQDIDTLYILGDLFEYWLGDDCASKTAQVVATELSVLNQLSVRIFFQHGNRDFLLGKDYANRCRMDCLPEETCITLYGQSVLIMHGDTLCTDDVPYQAFRQKVRHPNWQKRILSYPKWVRKLKAWQLRRRSKSANRTKPADIMDVNQDSVIKAMKHHDTRLLIHGHTHRPNRHEYKTDSGEYVRYVLGDWDKKKPIILEITPENITLLELSQTSLTPIQKARYNPL